MALDTGRKVLTVKDRATGNTVAYLAPDPDGIKNCYVEEKLNGQITLKFILPMTSSKWEFIGDRYAIETDEHEFLLVGKEEERDEAGNLISNVQYEGSYIALGEIFTPYTAVEILRAEPFDVLTQLLAPTDWTVGIVDVLGMHDLETEKLSCLANLWEAQKIWGGYLIFRTKEHVVDWVETPGIERPVHIRYGKNLRSIKREVDPNTANRLIVYGADGLDIRAINDGKLYVEDFSYTREQLGLGPTDPIPSWAIREAVYIREDIEDQAELKEAALKEVVRRCRPRIKYSIKMVDLRNLAGYEGEVFGIGDIVRIYDEEFKAIDVKQMVIRHRYNYFEREDCDLDIGDPLEDWAEELANMSIASRVFTESVAPNTGVKNLLKGLLTGVAKQIIGSKGHVEWTDEGGIRLIEEDDGGNPTGGEVLLAPGGIMLKDDNGVEPDLAITPDGILASKIIVNALYALATEDGYTKLMADGLHVYDNTVDAQGNPAPKLRVHIGQYSPGKFGLLLKDANSQETVIDEQGILQTWQDGRADNVDKNNPLRLYIYLPQQTKSIKKALLRLRLLAFRAYEKTISSSSETSSTVTSSGGGGTVATSSDDIWSLYATFVADVLSWEGDHNHQYTFYGHSHTEHDGYSTSTAMSGVTITTTTEGGHSHAIESHHTHNVSIPNHTHNVTVTVPGHTHGIGFGIYTGKIPPNVTVKVNGNQVGGTYSTDQAGIDIAAHLKTNQWNIIEITPGVDANNPEGLGRVDAAVFVQALMGI